MKKAIIRVSSVTLLGASPALASTGITEGFDGVFLWVFCGYCALIVVVQTFAAIGSLIRKSGRESHQEAVESREA